MQELLLSKYLFKISNNLKELLELHSMSILELQSRTGISYSSLHSLVNNHRKPTLETLVEISKTFDIKVSQLIGDLPLFQSSYSKEIKEIPIIKWSQISEYIENGVLNSYQDVIIVSTTTLIPEKCFALKFLGNNFFFKDSLLVFAKIEKELMEYRNTFVLVSSEESEATIKKLSADGRILFLETILQNLPIRKLCSTDNVLAHLIQIRTDFLN